MAMADLNQDSDLNSLQSGQDPYGTSQDEAVEFNIGLAFCDTSNKVNEADSRVVQTNADIVDFFVQWENDITDHNNAALDEQIDQMDKYTDSDDSGKMSECTSTYTQMSEEAQQQTNNFSSQQTTLNEFGENAMSDLDSFNSMAASIIQSLTYVQNLLA